MGESREGLKYSSESHLVLILDKEFKMRFDTHPIHKIFIDKGYSFEQKLSLNEIDSILREPDVSSVVALTAESLSDYYFEDNVSGTYPKKIWKEISLPIKKSIVFVHGRLLVINQLSEAIGSYEHSDPVIAGFLLKELDRLPFYLRVILQVPEDIVEFLTDIKKDMLGKQKDCFPSKDYDKGLNGKELGFYTESIVRNWAKMPRSPERMFFLFKHARNRVTHDVVHGRDLPKNEVMPAVTEFEKEIREKIRLADEHKVIKSAKAVKEYYKVCMRMDARSGIKGEYFLNLRSLDVFFRLLPDVLSGIESLRR